MDSTYAPIPVSKEGSPDTTPKQHLVAPALPAPGVSSSGLPWDLSDLTPQSEAQAQAARTLSSYFQQLIKQGVATMAEVIPLSREAIRKLFATSGGEAPDDVAARLMREDQTRWKNIKYVHVQTPPPRILLTQYTDVESGLGQLPFPLLAPPPLVTPLHSPVTFPLSSR